MKNQEIQEILQIILNIADLDFDISNDDYYEELRKLSYSVWEKHHVELLEELGLLRNDTDIDFQQFWFDCMGHPDVIPNRYSKSKSKYIGLSGRVPNTIENSLTEIGGFHDSYVVNLSLENERLDIILSDQIGTEKTTKLTFYGVEKYQCRNHMFNDISIEAILNSQILSGTELPMIESIFDVIDMNKELFISGKRLIKIEMISSLYKNIEFLIPFDSWSCETGCTDNKML